MDRKLFRITPNGFAEDSPRQGLGVGKYNKKPYTLEKDELYEGSI